MHLPQYIITDDAEIDHEIHTLCNLMEEKVLGVRRPILYDDHEDTYMLHN
jgi:hypothetical protein